MLFADDTSLFSLVHNVNISTNNLNNDLSKINDRAIQWKMNFNPNPSKQAQEVIFSRKCQNLNLKRNLVQQVPSQKHIRIHLQSFTKYLR